MQNINIEISGEERSGKTTTAFMLKHMLEEYGFKVNISEESSKKTSIETFSMKGIDRNRQVFNINVKN